MNVFKAFPKNLPSKKGFKLKENETISGHAAKKPFLELIHRLWS